MPRLGPQAPDGVALPQPLAPSDAARVRRIFALQAAGSFAEAARELERLNDTTLAGGLLAGQYLAADPPSVAELDAWLARYGDQPDAASIRGLRERLGGVEAPVPVVPGDEGRAGAHPAAANPRALFIQNKDRQALAAAARARTAFPPRRSLPRASPHGG